MEFQDKVLMCRDCGAEFAFSANEQEFYAQKGFTNPPGRCKECRAVHKRNQNYANAAPGYGYDSRPAPTYGGYGQDYGYDNRPAPSYDGYNRPAPNYGGGGYGRQQGYNQPRYDTGGWQQPQPQVRQLYPIVCADCGIQTQVPFQPSGNRPVFCGQCYKARTMPQY